MKQRRSRPSIVEYGEAERTSENSRQSVRIIIIEDDFLVALQAEAALVQARFDVVGVAVSFEEALELASAKQPELALVDIRLTGTRDGIEVAVELFQKHQVRCIFATAHQDDAVRARAAAARPLAWIPKPYTAATLVHAVRQAAAGL